ncbi:MAG: AraD1 family protein [Saprospiraceae bacterium]
MRLVQLYHPTFGRRVALVEAAQLRLLHDFTSIYDLALKAIAEGGSLTNLIQAKVSNELLDYDLIYQGQSAWQLLPAFDHPINPNACMLSGTGLTHKASADNRQQMHEAAKEETLTDSMKMYLWGVEGGHPPSGEIGIQPEWFYKGNGTLLRGHGAALPVPPYADDGGEEPEIAGIYVVDPSGKPWRVGFATANEFSDHVMERKNYLYLAPSKLRCCAIGPELTIRPGLQALSGKVRIYRQSEILWEKAIQTGEANMSHSIANLEYHHFKYANHLCPGQVHIHFFGADAFSFGEKIQLADGDRMEVYWEGMGRPLQNTLAVVQGAAPFVKVAILT